MKELPKLANALSLIFLLVILLTVTLLLVLFKPEVFHASLESQSISLKSKFWIAPDTSTIPKNIYGETIRYGRDLIVRTSFYLGPHGSVTQISNGMNCQNCHLEAGTKPYGNNYGSVASMYPKFRARSGSMESIEKRVNDCLERSLNGKALDSLSREMRAIVAYIKWVGKDVQKDQTLTGFGLWELPLLDRAADSEKGMLVYTTHCQRCHGEKGNGVLAENELEWKYPPLW